MFSVEELPNDYHKSFKAFQLTNLSPAILIWNQTNQKHLVAIILMQLARDVKFSTFLHTCS